LGKAIRRVLSPALKLVAVPIDPIISLPLLRHYLKDNIFYKNNYPSNL